MPYAVFVHVNLDPATNVNVPTRTSGAIRGTVHAPFSRDFAGRPFGPSKLPADGDDVRRRRRRVPQRVRRDLQRGNELTGTRAIPARARRHS